MARRKVAAPRKSDERLTRSIHLLELLSTVEGNIITAAEARRELSCTDQELDEYLALISALADRESGARARAYRDHDDIVLEGADAQLLPVRLSAGEGAALDYLLGELNLDDSVRQRLEHALLPLGQRASTVGTVAGDTGLGSCFATLACAIDAKRACRISYRAQSEREPHDRVVEPLKLEGVDGTGYLIAYHEARHAVRRYRLDRIRSAEVLDEQVAYTTREVPAGAAATLARESESVQLAFDAAEEIPAWAGITQVAPGANGEPTLVTVNVSARPWLFDQVLARRGRVRITAPDDVRAAFIAYATQLAETIGNVRRSHDPR